MKKYLLIILILISIKTFSQINESDTVKFQLRTSVSGNYQNGNVEVLAVKSKIDFTYKLSKQFVFKSQNNSLYQSFYNTEADNDIFSRNYIYYKPSAKVYPFGITYISTNYRRKINTRYFAGLGATVQLINKPLQTIKLSTTVVYESTKFKSSLYNYKEYDGSEKINLWRSTLYVGGWQYFFQKKLRLYYDAFWQPAFNNIKNYRTQLDIGIDFPVWRGLSFTTLYTYTHENVVIQNIKQDDKILMFGLSYYIKN